MKETNNYLKRVPFPIHLYLKNSCFLPVALKMLNGTQLGFLMEKSFFEMLSLKKQTKKEAGQRSRQIFPLWEPPPSNGDQK